MFVGGRPPIEELSELCKTMNLAQMAEHYGTYERLVWGWLKKYDLKPIPRHIGGTKKIVKIEDVKKCLNDGLTVAEMAHVLKVCPRTIYKRLKEKGFKVKDLVDKSEDNEKVKSGTVGYWCKYAGQGRHDCMYWDVSAGVCGYYLRTGERRPCPADNCTVYERRKKSDGRWESKSICRKILHKA